MLNFFIFLKKYRAENRQSNFLPLRLIIPFPYVHNIVLERISSKKSYFYEETEKAIDNFYLKSCSLQTYDSHSFLLRKLLDGSYAPVIILIKKFTLGSLFKYLLPGHFFNDSLTTL